MCLSSLCTFSSDESKLRQQQQDLEQSWVEVRQAVAGREEAEQSLQQIQAQLEESKVNLEKLCSELLVQQEHSEQGKVAATLNHITFYGLHSSKKAVCHSCLLDGFSGAVVAEPGLLGSFLALNLH